MDGLQLSARGETPFHFGIGENNIDDHSCSGRIDADDHRVSWNLHYQSTAQATLSDKGWIGFSRTPHSDAVFSGEINFDGRKFSSQPLGWGVQGHNCGYRHRNHWTWTHAFFPDTGKGPGSFEALTYELPLGMRFFNAVLTYGGRKLVFRKLRETARDAQQLLWSFNCTGPESQQLTVTVDGAGDSLHRLPYLKTDCSGSFEVANNSIAQARLLLRIRGATEEFTTDGGAVLEMAG